LRKRSEECEGEGGGEGEDEGEDDWWVSGR
jgi:hypothetical protein